MSDDEAGREYLDRDQLFAKEEDRVEHSKELDMNRGDLLPGLLLLSLGGLMTPRGFAETPVYGIAGEPAPDLGVEHWIDESGKPTRVKLSDYRGRFVYLYCFQSWCPGCHSHGFPALKKVSESFEGDDRVAFLAVQTVFEGFVVNTKDKLRGIQEKYELEIPFGHDAGDEGSGGISRILRNYRTGGTPWTILIDPEGRVIDNGFTAESEVVIAYFRQALKTDPVP